MKCKWGVKDSERRTATDSTTSQALAMFYLSAVFTERPIRRCRLINLRPDLVFIRARKPIARFRFNLLIRWG